MRMNQEDWIVEDLEDNALEKVPDIYKVDNCAEDSYNSRSTKRSKKSKNDILQQRSEASLNISEFNLTEVGKEKIKINELVNSSLKTTGSVVQDNLQRVKKLKNLNVPLSKQQQARIKRSIAKEKICEDVSKWDSLIYSNRTADQIIFPLKKPDYQMKSLEAVAENFVTKHPVEIAVSELLAQSENKLEDDKPLTVAEEKALKAMSAAEAKMRHDELMRHRALISYKEAKARYQNKIKSKKYHRLLKKEKLKKAMKEFEEMKQEDGEKALEKLAELDKLRILERMTLKHRNTGKWAKQQKLRAKYNPESRSILKEDLKLGKQLKGKVDLPETLSLRYVQESLNIDDLGLIEETLSDTGDKNIEELDTTDDPLLEAYEEAFKKTQEEEKEAEKLKSDKELQKNTSKNRTAHKKSAVDDIADFVSKEQDLESAIPDGLTLGDEDIDDIMGDIMPMSEAFGDEDCIAEFKAEKEAADKANKVKGIDLFLPGWGNWGGPGIQPSQKKRRRFLIKMPAAPQKKTELGHVILNEERDKKAAQHQVSCLPFPFTNVHQFESFIRQPIGNTWNPQSSFQNLVAPKVITKMGKIIEPIDTEDLVLNKATSNSAPMRGTKRKKANDEMKAF